MMNTKIFLSTDGKHTVQVETDGDTDTAAALAIAEELYDQVVEKYGLKSEQWKDFNTSDKKLTPAGIQADVTPTCGIHHVPMVWKPGGVSTKTGKPYNGFWSCKERGADGSFCNFKPATTGR